MHIEKTFLYTLLRVFYKIVGTIVFRATSEGIENFPVDQNCIILGNHISAWDPLMVASIYKQNEIHFIAKESLYESKLFGFILNKLHAFRVNRGESDMAAMREAMQILRDGHVLGIFPEGHRQFGSTKVEKIETGVAVMALKSKVPVVPVLISGQYRFFGKVHAVVGPAIALDDLRAQRADAQLLEQVKQRIIESLEALRPSTK